ALSQLTMLLPLALRLLVALGVLFYGPTDPLSLYAMGYLLAAAAALIASTLLQSPKWPELRLWRLPERRTLRIAGGYGVLSFNRIGPTELDKALAGALLPMDGAGIYSAAARVISSATLPV